MKFKIIEINDWTEDVQAEMGDSSHMSDGDIMRLKLEEYEEKVEQGKWPGLPFVCEAESEEEAVDKYNAAHCEYDYYKATEAGFEDLEAVDIITLRQLITFCDVNTLVHINDGTGDPKCAWIEDIHNEDKYVMEGVGPFLDRNVDKFRVGVDEDPILPSEKVPTMWVDLEDEE